MGGMVGWGNPSTISSMDEDGMVSNVLVVAFERLVVAFQGVTVVVFKRLVVAFKGRLRI
jgi:hypothetical protein